MTGLIFSIPGGVIGLLFGRDKINRLEGKSEREIKVILEDLRKEAGAPDF